MNWSCLRKVIPLLIAILVGDPMDPAAAVTFSSGSTGSLGAFAPASNTTVVLPADGILNYTTVTIPSGVTVTFQRNAANTPVTLLAQGDVSIAGTISVKGDDAVPYSGDNPSPPSLGGPGGFSGGQGGTKSTSNNNGAAGQGPGGGAPGIFNPWYTTTTDATYGAPADFVSLLPLFGGSGGGGGGRNASYPSTAGGAGGGGAIVIASTTKITVQSTGVLNANGGAGYRVSCDWRAGGAGSGGAIRLVAPLVTNLGTIQAVGGTPGCPTGGGPGRVRIEAFTLGAIYATNPAASVVTTPGPITGASTPALTSLPTVRISTIGGVSTPSVPGGTYTTADVTMPPGTTNPVTVVIDATNTPVPTTFTFVVLAPFTTATSVTANSTGTFASSTASASLTLPGGQTSVLNVHSHFVLP